MEPPSLKIVEVCEIAPSPPPATDFSLPLTYFDLMYVRLPPTEYIFFYPLPLPHPPFLDFILPKLKLSLSLTLSHFLPLAGNLTWPDGSPEPFILYKPGDAVSLTVAETPTGFRRLSENHVQNASESFALVPELNASDYSVAPAMSLQITSFPNTGFSIGIKVNHGVADGKSTINFFKSWASFCKLDLLTLPPELTPSFDRIALKNHTGIDSLFLKYLLPLSTESDSDPKVRHMGVTPRAAISDEVARSVFELTGADIQNLRQKVSCSQTRYLSSFVLTYAHVTTCLMKTLKMEGDSKIAVVCLADWRVRSELLFSPNHFGNGISNVMAFFEAREMEEKNGLAIVAGRMSDAIAEKLEKMEKRSAVEILQEEFSMWKMGPISKFIAAGGSPRFGVYDIDFGWGRAKKMEMTSISVGGGVISFADSKSGDGGIEVGIVLENDAMDVFASLFADGLKQSSPSCIHGIGELNAAK